VRATHDCTAQLRVALKLDLPNNQNEQNVPPTYLEHWSWDNGPNKSGGTLARSSLSSYLTASHVLYKICKPASIANTDVISDICIVRSLTIKIPLATIANLQ